MSTPSRIPEGTPQRCPVCDQPVGVEPSAPSRNVRCSFCGVLLWIGSERTGAAGDILPVFQVTTVAETTKAAVIEQALQRLTESGMVPRSCEAELFDAILKREALSSTGIGEGMAVPHTKHPAINRSAVAIIRLSAGVPFGSLDNKPVHTLGLILSPADRPYEHIRCLDAIAGYVRDCER